MTRLHAITRVVLGVASRPVRLASASIGALHEFGPSLCLFSRCFCCPVFFVLVGWGHHEDERRRHSNKACLFFSHGGSLPFGRPLGLVTIFSLFFPGAQALNPLRNSKRTGECGRPCGCPIFCCPWCLFLPCVDRSNLFGCWRLLVFADATRHGSVTHNGKKMTVGGVVPPEKGMRLVLKLSEGDKRRLRKSQSPVADLPCPFPCSLSAQKISPGARPVSTDSAASSQKSPL